MRSGKSRRRAFFKLILACLLLGSVFLFADSRKESLTRHGLQLLESSLSRGTDLRVRIGAIKSNFFGFLSFENVVVDEPWMPPDEAVVFKADKIEFRYRFLDFVSKSFNSKIEVIVKKPQVYCKPRLGVRKPRFIFLSWMRDWAISQKNRFRINVDDLSLFLGYEKRKMAGINIFYENNSFELEIPLSHIPIWTSDVSSVIKITGRLDTTAYPHVNQLIGRIITEGTVVNWNPVDQESQFDYVLSDETFEMSSSSFLGGVRVAGRVDFTKDSSIDFSINANNYSLSHLKPFLKSQTQANPAGRMDLDIHFRDNLWAPTVEARARIYDGWIRKRNFKAMDVNVSGIYPTVRLVGSRILLEDGSSMRFAEENLEARDLFKEKTYETLISESEQDSVVWGDWEFSRPRDLKDQPEFVMQRSLGDETRLHFRKFSEEGPELDASNSQRNQQMEVGFEYRLKSKDSLKLELRLDEEFVGVERKVKF